MTWTTTLNEIRPHIPCAPSWEKLLSSLGESAADDDCIHFRTILDVLGPEDAMRCMRALPPEMDAKVRLLNCDIVEQIALPHTKDPRAHEAVAVARRYARGEATEKELRYAREAAGNAGYVMRGEVTDYEISAAREHALGAEARAARAAAWAAHHAAGKAARDSLSESWGSASASYTNKSWTEVLEETVKIIVRHIEGKNGTENQ